MIYLAKIEVDPTLSPLQSAACTFRIALGPRAGQKVLTLKTAPAQMTQQPQPIRACLCQRARFQPACRGAL
jgi:hypothetical protein